MPPTDNGLSHVPFFRRLGEIGEGDAAAWRSHTAGLLTLRLLDRWMPSHAAGPREVALVKRSIAEVPDDRLATVLSKLTDIVRDGAVETGESVATLMLVYGAILEDQAEWALAADVYDTAVALAMTTPERDGLALLHVRWGYCLRQLGDVGAAAHAYAHGREVARAVGDELGELRIRNAEGNLALHRGDLGDAAAIFDGVIADARAAGFHDAFARASHDRGLAALYQSSYGQAASFIHTAIQSYDDPIQRERALQDLAFALARLGARDGAHDAFLIINVTAVQRDTRAQAAINLMLLAAEDGDEVTFEHYRRIVETTKLPTRIQAEFHLRLAEGYQLLGRTAMAELSYRVLQVIAQDHELREYVHLADEGVRGVHHPVRRRRVAVPESLAHIVDELRERRSTLTTQQ